MTRRHIIKHCPALPFFILIVSALLLLFSTGCAKKASQNGEDIPQEELYFDAKLGFSIIHPLTWTRVKVPVSSPDFRDNEVKWNIPSTKEPGAMSVMVYPTQSEILSLSDLLKRYLEDKTDYTGGEAETFQHRVGETLTATLENKVSTERLFIIHGTKSSYILSFSVATEIFQKKSPLFVRIAESLREL